jgi:hypothetical protein
METEQSLKARWQADAENIALDLKFTTIRGHSPDTKNRRWIRIGAVITLPDGTRFSRTIGQEEVMA